MIEISDNQDLLTLLVGYFESYMEDTRDARERSERDRDYVDHIQLSEEIKAELKKRRQPPTINNRIRPKVNFLRGLERQGRTDPKAYPRTPNHEDDAEAVTEALRYVADNADFDAERSKFFDSYLVEGVGGVDIIVSNDESREIQLPYVPFDRIWYDQHSRELDFSDAKYKGMVIWDDMDDAKAAFPNAVDVLDLSFSEGMNDTFSDKPVKWHDSNRKRVRIAQLYFKHGEVWHLAFFTKSGFLIPPTVSPWLDDKGEPECGLELQSPYIDRDGNRYGEPRFMIEQQDAINKRESKMLDLVSRRQTFGNEKSGINTRKNKQALNKSDGHVEMLGDAQYGIDFGVIPTGDMANGQFTLLQEAKQGLDDASVSAASVGVDTGDSGRAILAKQSGNQVQLTPLFDGKRAFEKRVYRQVWNRIRQFWTEERWIRVTDDEQNTKFVGLNRPITLREAAGPQLIEEFGGIPQEFENDPRLDQIVRTENVVSQIDVDIVVEDAPDVANLQIEQFEALGALAQAGITFPQEVYIQASQLKDKAKLLKMLSGEDNPEAQQAAQQEAQIAKELTIQGEKASIEKDKAKAFKDMAEGEAQMLENTLVKAEMGAIDAAVGR